MLLGRMYAPPVSRLLGEVVAVTVLLAEQMKQDGRLTLQLSGQGPIRRLVVDCNAALQIRGVAHADLQVAEAPASTLLGADTGAQLMLSLDLPLVHQPYQSIVPIQGENIAQIFEHYLAQSEQQPACLFLAADEQTASCLFLQKLPGAESRDADGWTRLSHLAATVSADELKQLDTHTLLLRLFHEEVEAAGVRVYDARTVSYHCPEDWEKVRGMLRALGKDEAEAILSEHGEISVQDDMCNREYRFTQEMVALVFAQGAQGKTRLH